MGAYFSKRLTMAAIQHNLDVSGCSFIDFGRPSRMWGIIVVASVAIVFEGTRNSPVTHIYKCCYFGNSEAFISLLSDEIPDSRTCVVGSANSGHVYVSV